MTGPARTDAADAWIVWKMLPSTTMRWAVYELDGEDWKLWGNSHHTRSEAIDAFESGQGSPTDRKEWRWWRCRGIVKAVRVYVGVSPLFDPFAEEPTHA